MFFEHCHNASTDVDSMHFVVNKTISIYINNLVGNNVSVYINNLVCPQIKTYCSCAESSKFWLLPTQQYIILIIK